MKHLSSYDDLNFKKYVIFYSENWINKTIYMVKFDKIVDGLFYYLNFWYIDETGEIDTGGNDWEDAYDIEGLVILYQTDDFDNGLDMLKLISSTDKYNL